KQTLQSLGEDIELLAAAVPPMQVSPHIEKKEDKTYSHESLSTKKLYRDTSRKLIGGVASGIAYYFEIDPSWVRLLFLLPSLELLGEGDFFVRFALLLYVVLWLLMPANAYLPEQTEVRRFFRNPYERFIAGVCSGFSYFLGIEVVFIRVVFLLSSFTGVGIVVYLLVWIITPLASQPLLYQRPPITLEDIEGKIKSFLGQKKMIAVLFLPLRWLSDLLKGSPKMSLRRGFYLMVSLLGMFMMIVAIVSIACLFCGAFVYWTSLYPDSGFLWLSEHSEEKNRLVWDTFKHALSGHMLFFLLLFTEVPFIFLGMGGWAILKRRWTFSNRMSWSLGVVWLIGLIGTSITVPMALLDFQARGSYKNTVTYLPPANGKIYLELNDNCSDNFLNVELTIEGHEKNTIELIQHYQAQGRDRSQAVAYAKTIEYHVQFNDSIVCFDKAIRIAEGVPFRGQHLTMKVLLPYQRPFCLSPKMAAILRRTLTPYGYSANDLAENSTWLFDENGLQCLNCSLQKTFTRKDKKKILQPSVGQFRKIHIDGHYIVR
ncbi:MAG: PspC domain-containing protein, partial [Flammeovirgaceae bacterium]|nr:PspC domain-containing protein [Flammeovirgaceae bacterium]